jgi:uncharacterized protein
MSAVETAPRPRIASLDVLRGVAILGTFASNAWLFAVPGGVLVWFAGGLSPHGPVEAGLKMLSNGKFLALLTLLFGVGIELQYRSAVRRGFPWPGRYPLRALILFVEGLLHYLLVFEFDVLMGYAITSLLVAHLVGRSEAVIRRWMWAVGATFAALVLAVTGLLLLSPDGPPVSGGDPALTASWPAQVADRVRFFPLFRIELLMIVPAATVLFLAGARLLRSGAFEDTVAGARIRKRLMIAGFGAGLPLNVLTAFAGEDWFLVDRYLLPPLVALGLLALVTTIVLRSRREPRPCPVSPPPLRAGMSGDEIQGGGGGHSGAMGDDDNAGDRRAGAAQQVRGACRTRLSPLRRGIAAVGRTALSCYVLQNLLAGALCYEWGLGLASQLDGARPWWVIGLWAGVSALQLVLASLWLRRFDRGPLELAMHRIYARRPAVGSKS